MSPQEMINVITTDFLSEIMIDVKVLFIFKKNYSIHNQE